MKNVLVATTHVTALPDNGLAGLNAGELICLDSENKVVTAGRLEALANTEQVFRFYVGNGDGTYMTGVWLNPRKLEMNQVDYQAPTNLVYTVDMTPITDEDLVMYGHAGINITVPSKNSFDFPMPEYICVPILFEDTVERVIARLTTEIQDIQNRINDKFGAGVITLNVSGKTLTATFNPTNLPLENPILGAITVDGALSQATVSVTGNPIGVGTGRAIQEMEERYAVASWGFNPNFKYKESVFNTGVFKAQVGTNYNQLTFQSKGEPNHPFYQENSMEVTQFLAFPGTTIRDYYAGIFNFDSYRVRSQTEPIVEQTPATVA